MKYHFPMVENDSKMTQNSISRYYFPQNPKCRFILFQYTNVYLCAKFGDQKPTIDENRRPQIRTCFWARCRNKIPQRNCNFISTKCFISVNRSSWLTDCAAKISKPRFMLRDQRGDQPKKIEKISISRAIQLGFLCSVRICSQRYTMWSS